MIQVMVDAAQHPYAPWGVLCLAGVIVVVEAVRASRYALWGDMFDDDLD